MEEMQQKNKSKDVLKKKKENKNRLRQLSLGYS